jgi:hypothetical protein
MLPVIGNIYTVYASVVQQTRLALAKPEPVLMSTCCLLARKNEIIRCTELLLEAINAGDYESYA